VDIRILGAHSCESTTTSCVCFLIDETLAIDAGGLTAGLSIQDQQKLGAILITHQHYDHIRDIPGIALNLFRHGASIKIYATAAVCDVIEAHLLNGSVYPEFHRIPQNRPTVCFNAVVPLEPQRVNGHGILAVPVNHSGTTVGYQITGEQGKAIFYTADTGPELSGCWQYVSPQLLIIDVTLPNDCEAFARETGHLTPNLLERELITLKRLKGYLPQVVAVHMDAGLEPKIKEEIAVVAGNLKIPIIVAHEGMRLRI
jgi:ribonuclease BN (tRNA processing enzyme)